MTLLRRRRAVTNAILFWTYLLAGSLWTGGYVMTTRTDVWWLQVVAALLTSFAFVRAGIHLERATHL